MLMKKICIVPILLLSILFNNICSVNCIYDDQMNLINLEDENMRISGVIFDFNGTLFWDSDKQELAWRRFAEKLCNRKISDDEFKMYFHGRTNSSIIEYLTGEKPDKETLDRLTQEKEEIYRGLCKQDTDNFKLAPGAVELLDFLHNNNIPITIATASEITNVKFFIKEFNLDKWFDTSKIVFDDGTFKGKPEPDIYLKAADKINISPNKCLVIEDAISGITAAKRANIGKIIAIVPKDKHDEFSKIDGVSQVIETFNEIDRNIFDSFPSLEQAEKSLNEAAVMNPGMWIEHSRNVAVACKNIAEKCPGLNPDKAYTMGLLHDIGRRSGNVSERHMLEGYKYCKNHCWNEIAQICITHSFMVKDIKSSIGVWDISEKEYDFMKGYVENVVYSDYDLLVQLCDSVSLSNGFCLLEKRFMDITLRYGLHEYTLDRYKRLLDIKAYFEEKIGCSIYALLPNVVETTFDNKI